MDPSLFKFRPALFALALVCFLLPFVELSCPGMSYSFSGIDVAFGTTVEGQKLDGQPLAAVALILAGLGIYVSLKVTESALKAATGIGGVGAILLFIVQSQVQGEAGRQGPVQVSFEVGYWLALVGLAGGAALSFMALKESQRVAVLAKDATTPTGPPSDQATSTLRAEADPEQ